MTADYVCADNGSVFLEIADSPREMDMVLHSIQDSSDDIRDIRFETRHIPGYGPPGWPLAFFVNDRRVATLVQTTVEQNQLESDQGPQTWVWLVLLYDDKGTFEYAVPLPNEIEPKSLGLYGSGNLLIVGTDKSTKAARMFVVSTKGDIINRFLLFDDDYNSNKLSKSQQPFSKLDPNGALDSLQIVANGDNLLLVPRTTSAPIIEVNEHGIVRTIPLQLPKGFTIASFLSRKGYLWKLRTYTDMKVSTDSKTGVTSGDMRDGPILEFNSFDGSLLRRIEKPSDMNANLACEHEGDYIALTTSAKDGRLEILKGAEVKQ